MGNIAISYRRADTAAMSGRIFDDLARRFGQERVFMDIDAIPFGEDFRTYITTALEQTSILIVIIGPDWLGKREAGPSRVMDDADPVVIEIATAFRLKIRVVPVLVEGATIPSVADLPESLKDLRYLNAATIDSGRDFRMHMDRLAGQLERALETLDKAEAPAEPQRAEPTQTRSRARRSQKPAVLNARHGERAPAKPPAAPAVPNIRDSPEVRSTSESFAMTAPIGLTAGLAGGSIVTLFFLWRLGLRGLSDSGYAFSELGFGDFWKNAEVAFALVAQLLLLAAYGTVLASVVSRTPKLNSRPWLWGTVAGTFPALCAFAYFWHAHCQPWDDCSFNWRAFGVFMTLVGYYVGFFGIPAAYVARSLRRNADHRNEITGPPIERVVAASLLAGTCATLPLVIFFGVCAAIGQPGEGTGAQLTLARDVWSSFGNPDTRFFEDTNQPWVRREAIWIVMFVGYGLFFGVLPLLTIASTLMLAAKRSIFERPLLFGVALGIIPSVVIWIFWARAHKMPPLLLVVGIVCTYGIPAAYLIRMFLGTRTSPVTMPSG